MLQFVDLLLTITHLLIVGFNLFGWIWPATRKAHFVCVVLTAGSWFILGIWFGMGYCPVTDWQWQIKAQLGQTNLPSSFIKYIADIVSGTNVSTQLVNTATLVGFAIAAMLSVYLNFMKPANKPDLFEIH